MNKLTLLFALLILAGQSFAKSLPTTSFYLDQLKALKEFTPVQAFGKSELDSSATFDWQARPKNVRQFTKPQVFTEIKTSEEFVNAVLSLNQDVVRQKQMVLVARHTISQTQAFEPLLNQFASFLTMTPTLAPTFKEHPFPGVSAIKLQIAEEISAEAQARLDYFLAGTAKNARILAYQIIQLHRKIDLLSRTIKLYQDLQQASESLYRNGKVSFAELTMISLEADRLQTQKNQYRILLNETKEKAFSMMNGHRPKMSLYSFRDMDYAGKPELSTADLKSNPALLAEDIRINSLESSIALIKRAAFPEFTSISSLPMKKNISASTAAAYGNPRIEANIEFSRIFVSQLQARRLAQIAEASSIKESLISDFNSHSEAFRLSKANLSIIRKQMLPELEKAFASVKSRYESGQASFQELVETEKRLLNLKERLIDTEFETLRARANMLYDLGKIQF